MMGWQVPDTVDLSARQALGVVVEQYDHSGDTSPETINRELRRWSLTYLGMVSMWVADLVLLLIAGWHLMAYAQDNSANPVENHLYVAIVMTIIMVCLWRWSVVMERRLLVVAEQRRGDHSFYRKFLDGLAVIKGR